MRIFHIAIAAVCILGTAPGFAQADRKAFVDGWASDLLARRAIKTWTPQVYAGPATAASLGTIAGMTVNADQSVPERQVVIRNKESFQIDPTDPNSMTVPAGSQMATQTW